MRHHSTHTVQTRGLGRQARFEGVLSLVFSFIVGLGLLSGSAFAADKDADSQGKPSIEDKTEGMQEIDGFFPLYWDDATGSLWMEIARFDEEVLHLGGLAAGLGSNDIGLDRGQMGGSRIVKFERVGPKIFMVQPNYKFRASTDNQDEVKALTDAFAQSILWGFKVAAETDGRVLVDMTDFMIRDTHGIEGRLRPGDYTLDESRSAIYMPMTQGFPKNTELEVTLTFKLKSGGSRRFGAGGNAFEGVGDVAATAEAATFRVHQSLVELPDDQYQPRKFDPRSGYGAMRYSDYSAPLGEPMTRRFIRRHRLEKKDPNAAMSEAIEPIVYYLDRGTPEPIRSALLEGGNWWNQAYTAAGFIDAFRVELLPEGASSLDIRYNTINWTHRSTRGWSYGDSIADPRTGEIIKGTVTLGSLRVRQDYMIAVGLLAPYADGTETPAHIAEWALARIRQLSAHEIGHTLGLGHNYYDSKLGRISVMDYPHPLMTLKDDGSFDYSKVYDNRIGEWDKVTVEYGYRQFPEGTDEDAALAKILDDAWERDVIYMSNQDLSANPKVDQWSNGADPAAELNRMMEIRRIALDRFDERVIKSGQPMATMEEVLVPLYLYHRFQVEAAATALGGMHYIYAMRGDGRDPVTAVPADEQAAALSALMATLRPAELTIPASILDKLPPRPSGYGRTRELFPRHTGLMFDTITPAAVAARHTIGQVLQNARMARVVQQHAQDSDLPGLQDILTAMDGATFGQSSHGDYEAEVSRAIERVYVEELMALAGTAPMPQVRAIASDNLEDLAARLTKKTRRASDGDSAHYKLLVADINRFMNRSVDAIKQLDAANAPPGAPIGEPALNWLGYQEHWWRADLR